MSEPYDSADRSRMVGPIELSGRYYRVIAVPERFPNWVPFWLDGQGLVAAFIATIIYKKCDRPPYQVRLWKFPRFTLEPSVIHTESFDSMESATRRAREIHEGLKNQDLPLPPSSPTNCTDQGR